MSRQTKSKWPTTSRHARGYGSEWDKLRVIVLSRDKGLCQCDECKGGAVRLTLANEVHHIISKAKGGSDDLANLMAVSHECHVRITLAEAGKAPRQAIGADGWPV